VPRQARAVVKWSAMYAMPRPAKMPPSTARHASLQITRPTTRAYAVHRVHVHAPASMRPSFTVARHNDRERLSTSRGAAWAKTACSTAKTAPTSFECTCCYKRDSAHASITSGNWWVRVLGCGRKGISGKPAMSCRGGALCVGSMRTLFTEIIARKAWRRARARSAVVRQKLRA